MEELCRRLLGTLERLNLERALINHGIFPVSCRRSGGQGRRRRDGGRYRAERDFAPARDGVRAPAYRHAERTRHQYGAPATALRQTQSKPTTTAPVYPRTGNASNRRTTARP